MPLGLLPATLPIVSRLAPPSGFRAAEGVRSAWPLGEGPFGRTPKRSGTSAQKAGRRYEKAALAHLYLVLGPSFQPSRWFKFWDGAKVRFCQLDGLLNGEDCSTIYECKTTFTADAYYQLRKLYEPVVRCALRPKRISLVVVCKHFDPAVVFPERYELTQAPQWDKDHIGVYQWKA